MLAMFPTAGLGFPEMIGRLQPILNTKSNRILIKFQVNFVIMNTFKSQFLVGAF